MLTHLDLFSGVGGFSLGLESTLKVETVAFCEIDKFCRKVLDSNFVGVPIFEDIRELDGKVYEGVDIITGGFPCQDVSVAGNRAGLDGTRSSLWFEFRRIINEARPYWVIVENVPGLLSSNGGRDFSTILFGLEEFGYTISWRVFDSQYYGVPQRRRRVFIVGSLGTKGSIEVLFKQKGLFRDSTESGDKGSRSSRASENRDKLYRGEWSGEVVSYDTRNQYVNVEISQTLQSKGVGGWSLNYMPVVAYWDNSQTTDTLDTSQLMKQQMMPEKRRFPVVREITYINGVPLVGVRRLTPWECERLQGFPNDWTRVCSDTQRYRQLGNAVTPEVVKQIGKGVVEYADKIW